MVRHHFFIPEVFLKTYTKEVELQDVMFIHKGILAYPPPYQLDAHSIIISYLEPATALPA